MIYHDIKYLYRYIYNSIHIYVYQFFCGFSCRRLRDASPLGSW